MTPTDEEATIIMINQLNEAVGTRSSNATSIVNIWWSEELLDHEPWGTLREDAARLAFLAELETEPVESEFSDLRRCVDDFKRELQRKMFPSLSI